jgi:SAM-dependent methyltransferase
MPDIAWNYELWNNKYDWEKTSPHWCQTTTFTSAYWQSLILPRIAQYLPVCTALEIAPGHGRWTEYLRHHASVLHAVDLAPNCIAACQERFSDAPNIVYHVNDGLSLAFLENNSIDFAFSFDSLVHVDAEVLLSYFSHLSRKLSRNGVGFIHHSNLLALIQGTDRSPSEFQGCRASTVSSEVVSELCKTTGLRTMCQELINWNSDELLDCFTLFCRADSDWDAREIVIENRSFVAQRTELQPLIEGYLCKFRK